MSGCRNVTLVYANVNPGVLSSVRMCVHVSPSSLETAVESGKRSSMWVAPGLWLFQISSKSPVLGILVMVAGAVGESRFVGSAADQCTPASDEYERKMCP